MAAAVVSLAPARAEPAVPRPASPGLLEQAPVREHVWHGASGRSYPHSVYSLVGCPPLPQACYMLVRRDPKGARTVLRIALGRDDAPTLNLARVRQRGAELGANEVHVHFLAASDAERSLAACDLRAGLFGALESEPMHAAA